MFAGTVEGNNIQAAYYTAIPSIAANSPMIIAGEIGKEKHTTVVQHLRLTPTANRV